MPESLQCGLIRDAFDLNPVLFPRAVTRIAEAGLKWPMVGEQHEALAVLVEPAGRIDAWNCDEVSKRCGAGRGTELATDAKRLVEQKQPRIRPGDLWHHSVPRPLDWRIWHIEQA